MAAFRGMHVSPEKHSSGKYDRKVGQTDGQTTDKVILLCRYASQATQKLISLKTGEIQYRTIQYYLRLPVAAAALPYYGTAIVFPGTAWRSPG